MAKIVGDIGERGRHAGRHRRAHGEHGRRPADRPGLAAPRDRAARQAQGAAAGSTPRARPAAAARAWACSTPPAAPRSGAAPIRSTPTRSPGPTTCSRTRRRWRWASSRATWPRWPTASRPIRMAELELAGKYDPAEHDEFFTYFNWHQFTDEEWELCPPVVAVGGDGAMYDIGFQNLSRADGLGQADQGAGRRHAGLLQHRRPGLHLRLLRPDLGHGPVRQGDQGQAGAAQGDRPDRHGAPHDLRAAEHDRPPEPHDRGLHSRV